jgi:Tol biopolymer transport system component
MPRAVPIALVVGALAAVVAVPPAGAGARTALIAVGAPLRVVDERGIVQWQGPHDGAWFEWSPDGRRLAYFDGGAIAVVDRRNWHVRTASQLGADLHFPAWSPDGSRLAFTDLDDGELYVVPARTCCMRRVPVPAEHAGDLEVADWSADGRHLVVFASGPARLLSVDPGTGATVVLDAARGGMFDVSPVDGSIVVSAADGSGVWRLEADGSSPVLLAASTGGTWPVWSPDGRWVAYADGTGLVAVRADGNERRQLTTVPGWSPTIPPSWLPDSRRVVYAPDREPYPARVVGLDSGPGRSVAEGPWITPTGPTVAATFAPATP